MAIQTNCDLQRKLLSGPDVYCESWLIEGAKILAPLPVGTEVGASVGRRLAAGCRTSGATYLYMASLREGKASQSLAGCPLPSKELDTELARMPFPCLIAPSNFAGAFLFPEPGYALLAGDERFLSGALPEGVDAVRARFARYTQRVAGRWPQVEDVARKLGPRTAAWKSPKDVDAHTATARQICLLRSLAAAEVSGSQFAQEWLDARRKAMDAGERVVDPLASLLDEVFSMLEDYSIDPALREPGDLTDEELVKGAQEFVQRLRCM